MNDKDIERAAISEILKEAKHTEDRNKLPENGLGINRRMLSQNLVSTLRNPIFSRKFRKHRVIGLDDESDYEDDTNHAKWKRDGDYSHLGDDDYIYDARDYFNAKKYREIVAYRCQKSQKYKNNSSKTHGSVRDACSSRHGYHGHPSKYMDGPEKQEMHGCEDGEDAWSDVPMNSSRKKTRHKDKDRVKKTKHRKKSKHKRCDDSVSEVFEEHKKHTKHKKHRGDKKDKLSKRRAKKSKKSKSSCRSADISLKVDVLESPLRGESCNFTLPKPFGRYDDRYDSKYSKFNGYYGNRASESCRSPESVGGVEHVDGTEIPYDDCSPNSQEFTNNCAYF